MVFCVCDSSSGILTLLFHGSSGGWFRDTAYSQTSPSCFDSQITSSQPGNLVVVTITFCESFFFAAVACASLLYRYMFSFCCSNSQQTLCFLIFIAFVLILCLPSLPGEINCSQCVHKCLQRKGWIAVKSDFIQLNSIFFLFFSVECVQHALHVCTVLSHAHKSWPAGPGEGQVEG